MEKIIHLFIEISIRSKEFKRMRHCFNNFLNFRFVLYYFIN